MYNKLYWKWVISMVTNIRLVKKNEFEELMNLMNTAFEFKEEEDKFEHILPKLYFKDNKDMIHYGAYVDNKLVASIGL